MCAAGAHAAGTNAWDNREPFGLAAATLEATAIAAFVHFGRSIAVLAGAGSVPIFMAGARATGICAWGNRVPSVLAAAFFS